jgi:hypothetical protein
MVNQTLCDSISQFTGNEDIKTYLRNFETRCNIEKLSDAQKFKLLANKLVGIAFDQYVLHQTELHDYGSLKLFLLKTYEIKQKKLHLYSSLFSDSQHENESIDQYYLRLTFKLDDANIPHFNSQTDAGKTYLFGFIAQTMRPAIKQRINPAFDPQQLDELLTELRRLEREMIQNEHNISYQNETLESEQFSTPKSSFQTPKRVTFYPPRNLSFDHNKTGFKYNQTNYRQNRFTPYQFRQRGAERYPINHSNSSSNYSENSRTSTPIISKNYQSKHLALEPPNLIFRK